MRTWIYCESINSIIQGASLRNFEKQIIYFSRALLTFNSDSAKRVAIIYRLWNFNWTKYRPITPGDRRECSHYDLLEMKLAANKGRICTREIDSPLAAQRRFPETRPAFAPLTSTVYLTFTHFAHACFFHFRETKTSQDLCRRDAYGEETCK